MGWLGFGGIGEGFWRVDGGGVVLVLELGWEVGGYLVYLFGCFIYLSSYSSVCLVS